MNPLLAQALGSIFRWLLAIAAGYFVQHGIWSQSAADNYVAAAALALASLVWSLWQKYKSRLHFLTALSLPAGTEEDTVRAEVKAGRAVVPLILLVALGGGMLALPGCSPKTNPALSPSGQAAANADAFVKRLGELQAAAMDAEANHALSTEVAGYIVAATVEGAQIAKDGQSGWLVALRGSWERWKTKIPPAYRQLPAVSASWVAIELLFAEYGV